MNGEPSCLVLGDNIFYGSGFGGQLRAAAAKETGAVVFGYPVADPGRYGVVEMDGAGKVLSLVEKPEQPRSNVAVTGLYFFDGRASGFARTLKPSPRGELEILDLIRCYLELGELSVQMLGRGFAWLDTGTHDALIQAGEFVRAIEERQGLRLGCVEEIAYQNGWIDRDGADGAGQVVRAIRRLPRRHRRGPRLSAPPKVREAAARLQRWLLDARAADLVGAIGGPRRRRLFRPPESRRQRR